MNFNPLTGASEPSLKPTITVIGVGGAGGNAVNNMIAAQLEGAKFVVANTDAQALENALTDNTVQLGANITQGLGAGANPDVGAAAAEEAAEELMQHIDGSHMVFITAGMGGGTGTGAAPVIARMAKEQGILTVSVVTKPFHFEGTHRMKLAENGLENLQRYVDTMIVIPNQNLFRIANEKTTFADAFRMADEVLHSGVRGVTDLMVMPGLINLDFADIRTVMREMGKAMMGTGESESERRAIDAAEAAISNPLLDDVSMKGARGVLINITGGYDMTLFEVDEAANRIRDEVDSDANIIFGSTFNESMEGKMRVSVVATGIDHPKQEALPEKKSHDSRYSVPREDNRFLDNFTFKSQPIEPAPRAEIAAPKIERRDVSATGFQAPQPAPIAYEAPTSAATAPRFEEEASLQRRSVGRHSPTRTEIAAHEDTPTNEPFAPIATRPTQETNAALAPQPAPLQRRSFQPQASSMAAPTTRHTTAAATQRDEWEDDEAFTEDEQQPGLFRRMTSRIATASRQEGQPHAAHRQAQKPPRQRITVAASNPEVSHASADQELEIPAFLRRQAN